MNISTRKGVWHCSGPMLILTSLTLIAACSSDSDNSDNTVTSFFFDDFSSDTTRVSVQDRLSDPSKGEVFYDNGTALVTVNSAASEDESIRFRLPGRTDTRYAVLALQEGSVAEEFADTDAKARGRLNTHLYNDTSADNCIGNISVSLSSRLRRGQYGVLAGAWRSTSEDCSEGQDYPMFNGEAFATLPDITPQVGTSNRLQISLDRTNSQLIFSVDGQDFSYPISTPIFDPYGDFFVVEAKAEDGATAVVRIDEFGDENGAIDLSDPDKLGRYKLSSSQPTSVENGELRLEANSTGGRVDNRFAIDISEQRYIKAQLRLSNESVIGTEGAVVGRAGGSLYYAAEAPPNDDSTGQVFAVSQLLAREDGTRIAEYCAWQALNSDFSEELYVLDGADDTGCRSFNITPEFDTNYTMGVWLDDANQQIVFTLDSEVIRHDITTPISSDDNLFDMRLQSRAIGVGSKAVVYVDNLRMDPAVD